MDIVFIFAGFSKTISTSVPDLIGWFGNIFFIIGSTLISRKNINGFYFNFVGNSAYIFQAFLLGMWSLVILSIWLCSINICGIVNWKKYEKISNVEEIK